MQRVVVQEEMEAVDPIYVQDKELIKPWIDAHCLKKIEGTWYKDGQRVGGSNTKRRSYEPTTTHWYMDIQESTRRAS